jgi:hypothetical protein
MPSVRSDVVETWKSSVKCSEPKCVDWIELSPMKADLVDQLNNDELCLN